jgi:hypothetical protein
MGIQSQLLLYNHLDGTLRIPVGIQVVGWWVGVHSLARVYHEGQKRDQISLFQVLLEHVDRNMRDLNRPARSLLYCCGQGLERLTKN